MRAFLAPLLLLAAAACADGRADVGPAAVRLAPRPDRCREVAPGQLAAALAEAADGAALCLAPGLHPGPVRITRTVTVWGPREAVIRAGAPGSVVEVAAPGVHLLGFTVDGTGGRFEVLDAGVHVIADDVVVEGLAVVKAVYGILVEKAHRATVRGNHVRGDVSRAPGLRGDTIRLWETRDSLVEANLVEDGRDIVVWYSGGNRVARNQVRRGRYGTHFMFSDDNLVEDNRYQDTVVGVFVMYSRGVTLRRNLFAGASGAAGIAIGLKDSGNLVVERNVLVRDATGIFVDQSPGRATDTLTIRGNLIRQCDVGLGFHTTPARTTIEDNDLADNLVEVQADGGVDPAAAVWRGNHYGDYAGYDADGDGVGDVPHQARAASEELVARHPDLAFFRGAAVLGVVDVASALMPMWQPRTLLVDAAPRMAPRTPEEVLDAR